MLILKKMIVSSMLGIWMTYITFEFSKIADSPVTKIAAICLMVFALFNIIYVLILSGKQEG